MAKPFLTYEQQIDKLKIDKGLIIDNRDYALEMLKQIGYFKLIGGYKHLFQNKSAKKYKYGIRFEDIVNLYMLDESLRDVNLKYILKAEQQLKSLISYYFCNKYGDSQSAYLTKTNYDYTTQKNKYDIDKLIKMFNDNYIAKPTDYPYINHAKSKHNNLPLWVLINALTFGNVSKMYILLHQGLQIEVSKNYKYINEKQLGKITTVLTKFRNACAHGERLFSYKTRDSIPDLKIHSKLNIPKKGGQFIYGKNDLFSVVVSLLYLLPSNYFLEYKRELNKALKEYLKGSPLTQEQLFQEMGFPENWTSITRYRDI